MPPEYSSTLYRESFDTGYVSSSGAAAGGTGDPKVVVARRPHLRTGGWEGGRSNGGVEVEGEREYNGDMVVGGGRRRRSRE